MRVAAAAEWPPARAVHGVPIQSEPRIGRGYCVNAVIQLQHNLLFSNRVNAPICSTYLDGMHSLSKLSGSVKSGGVGADQSSDGPVSFVAPIPARISINNG